MTTKETEKLFLEIEEDLEMLSLVTKRTLLELDAEASSDLSRWLGAWSYLEDFPPS